MYTVQRIPALTVLCELRARETCTDILGLGGFVTRASNHMLDSLGWCVSITLAALEVQEVYAGANDQLPSAEI